MLSCKIYTGLLTILCASFACACNGHAQAPFAIQPQQPDLVNFDPPPLELRPLIVNGPARNRVDITFFSDGYTIEERDKFFRDALFLATNVTDGQTYATVLPTLNFWAAFTPSNESGIGVGGVPKDTVYGLYRDGTELRGVYYDKPEVAHAACRSIEECDYPILLGNDPLYGGLGGEITVVTSSYVNGPLVLRHELGHSIIDIGDEYDGSFAYYGVNSAHRNLTNIPWSQWFSEPDLEPREQRSNMPMQVYPWTMLNTSQPWIVRFNSSGLYDRHLVRFSLSGIPNDEDLEVALDGVDLGWKANPAINLDRWHYDIHQEFALEEGEHELKFALKNQEIIGIAQLCSSEILEFGTKEEFVSTPDYYGLYPTFSDKNITTYRPTNEDCLMRVVTSPDFCKACIEGLWLSVLRNISFIDDVSIRELSTEKVDVQLILIPLAQFGIGERPEEVYTITWFNNDGEPLASWANQTSAVLERSMTNFAVELKFWTAQVPGG
ncbi:IgA peptidase M64-domain-containing protein [Flagelloscypha sp. PMI_526]|nr:IgA peptidase M64-domain-containing protein [Flagelloscypha sp. PMI_526]